MAPGGEVPMETVVKMRKYRTLEPKNVEFFTTDASKNVKFTLDDLARSGLQPEDMDIYPTSVINLADGAVAGYQIPYYDLKGQILKDKDNYPTMWRTKFEYPTGVKGPKYLGPSTEALGKCQLPPSIPYIPPQIHRMESNELIIAEGEKKTASIIKLLQLPAIGIGGCQMWRDPDGSGNTHPWILELLRCRNTTSIIIVPDGDIARYDISTAYGTLSRALEYAGFKVQILHPPGKIDDLLVQWGSDRIVNWAEIPKRSPSDLVQSTKSLITRYSLSFKTDAKGNPTVHQHTSNIMRLMEEHPAFPKVWLNQDNNTVMIGEEKSEPNRTDMDLANYFQYNLGFDKVSDRVIHNCVLSLARTNRRSPFLDYVNAQAWDGKPRLDTWLSDFWGCENTDYSREIASKWLVSACARLDKPGTKIDWMLIVVGPQGVGKTTMPFVLFPDNARTLYGEQNDKDLHMLMHSALCVGFDELDSFGKRESSNLKAMITRNEDAFRPPYGAIVEVFPRRFTLYGCGNRYEFLQHDPSGYRRYAIVEVTQLLDFTGLEAGRDQLWAEAWDRYRNGGVRFWEVKNASANSEKYAVPNVIEEMIINYIETERIAKQATTVKDGFIWLQMPGILQRLDMEREIKNTNITREISGILRKLGAVTFQGSGPMGKRGRWYKVAIDC
jgi:virulence-associated protein E